MVTTTKQADITSHLGPHWRKTVKEMMSNPQVKGWNPDVALLMGSIGAGGLGAAAGAPIGALAGGTAGAFKGRPIEGFGRGTLRGGATGAGSVLGALLASLLADKLGANPGTTGARLATLGGTGLGGLAGYLGSGAVLGKPSWENKKEKEAADDYSANQVGFQQYLPTGSRRELTPEEVQDVERGQNRWFPAIFQNFGTKATDLMSSPGKGALLAGLGAGSIGALLGSAVGGNAMMNNPSPMPAIGALAGGAIGGLGAGGVGALLAYLAAKNNNQGILDQIRRGPVNATKRDLLADPVVQKGYDRQHEHKLQRQQTAAILAALASRR